VRTSQRPLTVQSTLIAQAQLERLKLVTREERIARYGVATLTA
jgi:hypothetical protein